MPLIPGTQVVNSATNVELAYVEGVGDVTVTATVEATPQDILSAGALIFSGTQRIRIEFWSHRVGVGAVAGSFCILNLWDDSTDLGRIIAVSNGGTTAEVANAPAYGVRYLTPTAGTHTYKIRGWRVNSDGLVHGGASELPHWMRISGA